ncbi:hypothetical protein SELMODRAFT_441948 [Selaginella moellendorffii]|uniref:PROP1-like PPR domain-containing protein n=1 Tax=Selaginella moellendorffii TaxID=88036 RepID=D8RP20_SELML|nr:putative pentatricopeptide repeat-containing protein At1g12700, mitochondrial [Selaginella moellendorffii]EFJ26185.1 hypothetical protein SELMODRAFT_441948 [Selaginella moellendorffii]|eukprot:XP_002972964.1 putative pentatricopeptide repeat-containing protein At1g12700, mitochondrial [Selaginella moellendorffii]
MAPMIAPSLLNTGVEGLLHPFNVAHSRTQLFSGFECAGIKKYGIDLLVNGKYFSRFGRQNGHFQRLTAASKRLDETTGNSVEKPELDELIAAIVYQAEIEGSLSNAFQRISTEDWSKVLSNVGKKHWELALAVFGVFKETSSIFLKPNTGVQKNEEDREVVQILKVYTTMVAVLARHGRLEEAEAILTEVQQLGFGLDLFLYNALLGGYAKQGMAERMLDCMLEMQKFGIQPDHVSYEQLVAAYLNSKTPELKLALEVLDHMHSHELKASQKTYSELIAACWKKSEVENADKCFSAMIAAGHSADSKVLVKLMQLHAQKGNHTRTQQLFQMLKQAGLKANSTCYEQLLLAYCKAGCLDQAFTIFRESKQIAKPSLIVYNILLDACAKAGLHLQAMQLYNEVCGSGLKANAITYTSAITALVRSGRCAKAEELYKRMLRLKISPTAHTYTSMIHAYAMKGWTRSGHEVCVTMRSNCQITAVAYNAMLHLYIRGEWYTEAANILSEMDSEDIEPGVPGYGVLIAACGDSSPEIMPLVRTLETSRWETCRIVYQLMFLPLYESCESLLEGSIADLPKDVMAFLQKLAQTKDAEANLSFYNSLMDGLWRKGLKRRAKSVMVAARSLLPWYKRPKLTKMKLLLDLGGLSLGAAQVAVLDWLSGVAQLHEEKSEQQMVLVTGSDSSDKLVVKARKGIKKAVGATLAELGSPFAEDPQGSGRLVASVYDVVQWQAVYGISSALMLLDNTQPYITQ